MTRDEKIEILEKEKAYMIGHGGDRQAKALDSAIKALKQESVLDKIRAEIKGWQEDIHDNENDADKHDFVFERIFEIIDEYKTGGE